MIERVGMSRRNVDWYVVHVRQGCEQAAAARLACTFRLITYCPEIRQRARYSAAGSAPDGIGSKADAEAPPLPLFPGYFFVQWPGPREEPAVIARTPGCGRLVRVESGQPSAARLPIRLACAVIDWLRLQLAAAHQAGGLPALALCGRENGSYPPAPLRGLEAALDGLLSPQDRVTALLNAIGAETDGADIGAEDDPPLKRPRRTRGHGRKIHYG